MTEDVDHVIDVEISDGKFPCPVCSRTMHVEKVEQVSVDVCPEHGIWLEKGEMDAIKKSIRAKTRRNMKVSRKLALRRGREQGAMWGWWSLWFD